MSFGLPAASLQKIKKSIAQFPKIDKAIIFGSRAMGNYHKGSDVDLAICGKKGSSQKCILFKIAASPP